MKVVWVFGPGCVGKKTFIWNAAKASAHEEYVKYKLALGFSLSETVLPVLPSIHKNDGTKFPNRWQRRYVILSQILKYPLNFIIHGQWDQDQYYIDELVDHRHRCYYLETTEDQYHLNRETRGLKQRDYKKLIETWESDVIPKLKSIFGRVQRITF